MLFVISRIFSHLILHSLSIPDTKRTHSHSDCSERICEGFLELEEEWIGRIGRRLMLNVFACIIMWFWTTRCDVFLYVQSNSPCCKSIHMTKNENPWSWPCKSIWSRDFAFRSTFAFRSIKLRSLVFNFLRARLLSVVYCAFKQNTSLHLAPVYPAENV